MKGESSPERTSFVIRRGKDFGGTYFRVQNEELVTWGQSRVVVISWLVSLVALKKKAPQMMKKETSKWMCLIMNQFWKVHVLDHCLKYHFEWMITFLVQLSESLCYLPWYCCFETRHLILLKMMWHMGDTADTFLQPVPRIPRTGWTCQMVPWFFFLVSGDDKASVNIEGEVVVSQRYGANEMLQC